MIDFIIWYFLISLVGWVTFPISFRYLKNLSDRGYALSRPLGLMLWGFVFWLMASLNIISNNAGGVLLSLMLICGASIWTLHKKENRNEWTAWIKTKKAVIITGEVLFLLAFLGLAVLRSANPDIVGTEKPMELAFINAILRSPGFPPNDPWLSGYAISYYYFGYVLVAMLVHLSGTASAVAFNLAISLWFGMTALAAYGILYSLLSTAKTYKASIYATGWALLGPLFILVLSNIEGFLEVLHARGIFWSQATDGSWSSSFWTWLNILEINQPFSPPPSWIPERAGGYWWWRASRVLQDFDLKGNPREIIDEFPFFSYLLADLHPHVLAMPFALLAVGLALNVFLGVKENGIQVKNNIFQFFSKSPLALSDLTLFDMVKKVDFWLAAVVLGGLSFINTWDFPIYVALYCAVYTLTQYQQHGWSNQRIAEFIELGLALGIAGIVLYLPFYIGFSSQAGGILPSLEFYTRGVYFVVMFATLLIPILLWLAWKWFTHKNDYNLSVGLKLGASITAGLWAFSYLLGLLISTIPDIIGIMANNDSTSPLYKLANSLNTWGGAFTGLHGGTPLSTLITGSLLGRLASPLTWITLTLIISLVWGALASQSQKDSNKNSIKSTESDAFVLFLILIGVALVLTPEFIYLRDQFGWRMNTIFKFYFQAWMLWGLAASYATILLWTQLTRYWKWLFRVSCVALMAMGLAYPIFGLWTKTNGFNPETWTLDGSYHIQRYNPDEMQSIEWLQKAPLGIVAESIGGSYSGYARISTYTGHPTVLGWPGHESQWRGGAAEMGSRETDIQKLYVTIKWNEAKEILDRYNIRYVYIGSLERSTYRVNEAKFQNNLKPIYQQGTIVIYEYTGLTNHKPLN